MMKLGVISLIPEMFDALNYGVTGRAIKRNLINIQYWNPRDWSQGNYHRVDDKPYGGGPGMVMMYEPLQQTILHARTQMLSKSCSVVYLSPQGKKVQQNELNKIAIDKRELIFLCGRYEGIDERLIDQHVDEEWSLGDFVLSGGELAAMIFIDAIVRLIPGSLGHHGSAEQDSFMNGVLDYPHYTRPAIVNNLAVPEVLLNGCHNEIARWRRKQALGKTWLKRPDLLHNTQLTGQDVQLLTEFKNEHK